MGNIVSLCYEEKVPNNGSRLSCVTNTGSTGLPSLRLHNGALTRAGWVLYCGLSTVYGVSSSGMEGRTAYEAKPVVYHTTVLEGSSSSTSIESVQLLNEVHTRRNQRHSCYSLYSVTVDLTPAFVVSGSERSKPWTRLGPPLGTRLFGTRLGHRASWSLRGTAHHESCARKGEWRAASWEDKTEPSKRFVMSCIVAIVRLKKMNKIRAPCRSERKSLVHRTSRESNYDTSRKAVRGQSRDT